MATVPSSRRAADANSSSGTRRAVSPNPVDRSKMASRRSPWIPSGVTAAESTRSPCRDFTGYRHSSRDLHRRTVPQATAHLAPRPVLSCDRPSPGEARPGEGRATSVRRRT